MSGNILENLPYILVKKYVEGFFVKKRNKILILTFLIIFLINQFLCISAEAVTEVPEPSELFAKSAVLLDGDSGRVLYSKEGNVPMPMASTTKIMTLIVVLENAKLGDTVIVSKNAARQPKVHLGMREGQKFKLEDLCYSLMLESHNDSAVALAEHIGGSVEKFVSMMNEKARDIGCTNTYYITPNGLDATVKVGKTEKMHSTTAEELAKAMRYCIMISPCKEKFLQITRTPVHVFSDVEGKSSYSCNNHNAFLQMMPGALSGKTGFTGKAGYCYVGALEREGKTFIVALLACGWPNNKTYKWKDTKRLMEYGVENYEYREVFQKKENFATITIGGSCMVEDGKEQLWSEGRIVPYMKEATLKLLLNSKEKVDIIYNIKENLHAPIKENDIIGTAEYRLNNKKIKVYNIYSGSEIAVVDFKLCVKQIINEILL